MDFRLASKAGVPGIPKVSCRCEFIRRMSPATRRSNAEEEFGDMDFLVPCPRNSEEMQRAIRSKIMGETNE